ncbi:MAG: hypothetical protein H8D43_00720 [Chloroflexi bacterium]|nr:hypothetical protein [Chloroflexota bacterium]
MDWEHIEAIFAQDIEFTRASREEVVDALSHLEQELGLDWIKATKASISTSSALGRMVEFAKCLKVADAVTGGNTLKKKLHTDYSSEECQGAIAESLTAERLLASGATVQYEPQLPGMTKRPDLFANWGTRQVAFEVVFPSLSAQDVIENQQMDIILLKCGDILTSGTLNIYLTESGIAPDTANSVVAAVKHLSNDTTRVREMHISERAYLAYDPELHELCVPVTEDFSGEEYVYRFPVLDPAYHEVKAKLKILTPMHSETLIKATFPGSRFARVKLIIRIHRPVRDPRALSKAEQKHTQLPSESPGVVVIDMRRTSMSLKPDEWAKYIRDSFVPGLYPKMSAVWLRSGQPEAGAEWQERLIVNPYATTKLPTDIAKQLIPGAAPIDLG